MRERDIKPRLLVPDATPLSLLALAGGEALDYLFAPEVEVWVTDMVQIEVTRDPDPGDDQRKDHRKVLKDWFERNSNRIWIKVTPEGIDYKIAMENWRDAGADPSRKPRWKGRGEKSIYDLLTSVEDFVHENEKVVILMDDGNGRTALTLRKETLNIDIISTITFLYEMESVFGIVGATDIWPVIKMAAGKNDHGVSRVPERPLEDPLYKRIVEEPDERAPSSVFRPRT